MTTLTTRRVALFALSTLTAVTLAWGTVSAGSTVPPTGSSEPEGTAAVEQIDASIGVSFYDNKVIPLYVQMEEGMSDAAEAALGKAGITVNKNAIPFDQNPPMVASGIRIGTPAVTSRGMREPEMDVMAALITRALASPNDDGVLAGVRGEVEALCQKFPLYPG